MESSFDHSAADAQLVGAPPSPSSGVSFAAQEELANENLQICTVWPVGPSLDL
jgi:hypothetical protein